MFTIQEFNQYFEEHMTRNVNELQKKYELIGDNFLKNIEESIFATQTKSLENMREYYYFWERKVYNAIVKMVLRALLS
jgi:dynein heavy chain